MSVVYFSAPHAQRGLARAGCALLLAAGHDVCSTWHDVCRETPLPTENTDYRFVEIDACDVLLAYSGRPSTSFGGLSLLETGYALGRGRRVVVVGVGETAWHLRGDNAIYSTVRAAIEAGAI